MARLLAHAAWQRQARFDAGAGPAVLLMCLSKTGLAAGFGSLAVPLMALRISVPQAAAVMLRWGTAETLLFGVFVTSFKLLWEDLQ